MPTEASLTAQIVALLKARGCWVLKVHGHPWQRRGVPDILACVPLDSVRPNRRGRRGRFLAIEVKSLDGQLSPLQVREAKALVDAGAICIVAHALADVMEVLDDLGKRSGA